jgi:hypothetical protein
MSSVISKGEGVRVSNKKKEPKREYQQNQRPMGVYQIRNIVNDKVLVGAALNLPGVLNRHQFELRAGTHRNRALQAEWHEFGGESFAFEILDELTPREDAGDNYRADLAFLEELWLEKLQPYGDHGYNEKKKGKEERLRLMAQKRSGKP